MKGLEAEYQKLVNQLNGVIEKMTYKEFISCALKYPIIDKKKIKSKVAFQHKGEYIQ